MQELTPATALERGSSMTQRPRLSSVEFISAVSTGLGSINDRVKNHMSVIRDAEEREDGEEEEEQEQEDADEEE